MKKSSTDILNGNIWTGMAGFVLPLALSALLQQLFTAADQIVVGQFAGSAALAAVGDNSSIVALLVGVFTSISIGTNAKIALCIGAGHKEEISRIVHTSVTFAFLCGAILLVITQFIAYPVHVLIATPDSVIVQAVDYLKIYALGFPFSMLYNFGAAILRSKGDTRRPMIALVTAGIVNVFLNLFFVIVLHMGVSGVAAATTISNILSSVWVFVILLRETDEMKVSFQRLGIDFRSLISILQIGGPAAIQSAVFCFANVCIQSGINSLGQAAMAGSAAVQNYESISYTITNSFGQALTTYCGQNYGAGNYDRCRKAIRITYVENILVAATFDVLVNIFRQPLIMIFSSDPEVIRFAYERLLISVGLHFMITSYELLSAALRSMGCALMPALLTIIGSVCFRVTWLYTIFRIFPDYRVLIAVYPASWVLTGSMMFLYYMKKRREIGLIDS